MAPLVSGKASRRYLYSANKEMNASPMDVQVSTDSVMSWRGLLGWRMRPVMGAMWARFRACAGVRDESGAESVETTCPVVREWILIEADDATKK